MLYDMKEFFSTITDASIHWTKYEIKLKKNPPVTKGTILVIMNKKGLSILLLLMIFFSRSTRE